ncbi:pre-rRNA-processing protein TSR2 homolog [Bactrocera neohumeralis]|uniref:pre-rRNA-processing protein TSR2 homolog n=1 Tax=Bactrocera tryoni TaxID=59916 RepID=UPI001A9720A7|nr:pre-rRNA-processing protein TSR2 homolog [Bactrocera tryoni]XP_050316461.1 pre-rRNA-processing protein TSR2 homolog [Bactrocera neohumeralis]
MTQADFQKNFRLVLEKIFNNWQNLRLAVEHGMGGRNGQQLAIEIMDYTYKYCIGNENITQGELQDVLEDLLDQEFDTICDDNSIPEICRNLLRYKALCLKGEYALIESELSKLPQGKDWLRPDVKIVYTPVAGEDSSSDEDDESGDSEDGMDVDDDDSDLASCSRVTRSQTRRKQQEEFVEPEPGWTTVRTRRK